MGILKNLSKSMMQVLVFFFIMLWTRQKQWCKFRSFLYNVVNTSRTVMQVSIFSLTMLWTPGEQWSKLSIFFTMFWTHQKPWCMCWSFLHNVVNTQKTMKQVLVFYRNVENTSKNVMQVWLADLIIFVTDCSSFVLNPFYATGLFLYPLKTSKKL